MSIPLVAFALFSPALQRNVDVVYDLGFVKKKLDIKKYADLSLVKEAKARLDKEKK